MTSTTAADTATTPVTPGVTTEVGRLRTVMLHRPGPELQRLTPRNNDKLLFDGIPWVARAQEEHDAFADALRSRGVEVLYLTGLLQETLAGEAARDHAIRGVTASLRLARRHPARPPAPRADPALARAADRGAHRRPAQRRGARRVRAWSRACCARTTSSSTRCPTCCSRGDSSVWIGHQVAVTSLAMPARDRETQLTELIYTEHPRFAASEKIHGWHREHLEGGDVLLLSPGVLAVGVGERTTPAGVERLARQLFADGEVHTVLAVPIAQERATMHLDTVCTMVDVDKIVMYPNVADHLTAHTVTAGEDGNPVVAGAEPFLVAAARRWASTRSTRSTPASTRSPPSASSGTTATTPWPSRRGSPSPTSATSRPTAPRGGRHRGRPHLGLRARLRARRPALHVLPHRARRGLRASCRCSGRRASPGRPRRTTSAGVAGSLGWVTSGRTGTRRPRRSTTSRTTACATR